MELKLMDQVKSITKTVLKFVDLSRAFATNERIALF